MTNPYPWSELAHLGRFFYVNDDHTMELDENTRKAHKELSSDRVAVNELSETLAIKISLLDQLNLKNQALYEENLQLKRDKDSLEKEKDEVVSSKLAGEELIERNPAITELCKPNRPSRVADRWSSLFTDEWSDAYEEITYQSNRGNNRNDAVPEKQLMNIVVRGHKEEYFGLGNAALLQAMESFVANALSQRQCSSSLIETVKTKCLNDYNNMDQLTLSAESHFVEKCAELCWLMCTADPPMVIEFQNFESKPMDSGKFNEYDKTGSIVEFVVWPVLLLYKDGPVLSKGTVKTCFVQDQTDRNITEESSNPISQPPVKCNGGIIDNTFGLVVGDTIDNTEQYAKESSKTANSDSLDSEKPVDVEIIDEKNAKKGKILPHEESKPEIEITHDGDSYTNGSSNEKTKSYDKDHQLTEGTKPVAEFRQSVETLIQSFKNKNVNKLGTKDPVMQSLSPVKEDKTISKNLGNNQFKTIENRVNDNEQCQSHDSNASTGNIVSPKSKYFVKPDPIDKKKKHTDTLPRHFRKHLQRTTVPRQLSVDKHQPY